MLIQKWRLQRGWSQEQLAAFSGLSVRTIQRIENGQKPSTESLKALAAVFNTDFTHLSQEINMTASAAATAAPDTVLPTPSTTPPPSNSPETLTGVTIEEEAAMRHVRALRRFYLHVMRYVLVVSALAVFNVLSRPNHLWVLWVAGGWGLGLLVHALRVYSGHRFLGPQWERRQVERYLGRKL